MKTKFIFLIAMFIIYTNCTSNDDNSIDQFYWNQTACSDPWGTGNSNSENETKLALIDFLETKEVSIIKTRFENYFKDGELPCLACHCKTGIRIFITVDKKYTAKMIELAFTKL
ncbi:hypothetical protein [Aureibaculum conchae]|uniref:hypothetical protein n=1 Tax=Aureibaculum sp. 2308TA14-22 TaxID=3108392 RepID=UPI0033975F30